jgi:hypothetical protein
VHGVSPSSPSRNEDDYNVKEKGGDKLADYIPVCLGHATSFCAQTCLDRLNDTPTPAREAHSPNVLHNSPMASLLHLLVYSGPRVCNGPMVVLERSRDASSVPCDPPLAMGEPRATRAHTPVTTPTASCGAGHGAFSRRSNRRSRKAWRMCCSGPG